MKTTTPKKINRRDKVVDSIAKKFANHNNVEQIISTHRKKQIKPIKYVYILIGLSVISTSLTSLVMTGKIAPGLTGGKRNVAATVQLNSVDLLKKDLNEDKIGPDQFALYLKDYLIRYDSLPDHYKTSSSTTTSSDIYRALYAIWPQVNLRTRALVIKALPRLEKTWNKLEINQQQ